MGQHDPPLFSEAIMNNQIYYINTDLLTLLIHVHYIYFSLNVIVGYICLDSIKLLENSSPISHVVSTKQKQDMYKQD